jgi:hypothetical protein
MFDFYSKGGEQKLRPDVMSLFDREGMYDGDVLVSLQSSKNNSSMRSIFRNPRFIKSPAGTYIKSRTNKTCVSSLNVKDAVMIDSRDDYKSCKIIYDNTDIVLTVVFMAG